MPARRGWIVHFLPAYPSLWHRNTLEPNAKVFGAYEKNRTPGAYRLFWCYGRGKLEMMLIAITD